MDRNPRRVALIDGDGVVVNVVVADPAFDEPSTGCIFAELPVGQGVDIGAAVDVQDDEIVVAP